MAAMKELEEAAAVQEWKPVKLIRSRNVSDDPLSVYPIEAKPAGLLEGETYLPESAITPLVAQVEEAIARIEQTDCEAEFGDDYEAEVKDAAADLRKALADFQKPNQGEDGR